MKVFLAALLLVGLCVLGMCVGVLFHKGFPKYDVGSNPEMRKRGITCYKDEDARIQREASRGSRSAACTGEYSEACDGCALYQFESITNKETAR